MRGMAHLQTWIKQDRGEELPQENFEAVPQAVERNQGRTSAIKN